MGGNWVETVNTWPLARIPLTHTLCDQRHAALLMEDLINKLHTRLWCCFSVYLGYRAHSHWFNACSCVCVRACACVSMLSSQLVPELEQVHAILFTMLRMKSHNSCASGDEHFCADWLLIFTFLRTQDLQMGHWMESQRPAKISWSVSIKWCLWGCLASASRFVCCCLAVHLSSSLLQWSNPVMFRWECYLQVCLLHQSLACG